MCTSYYSWKIISTVFLMSAIFTFFDLQHAPLATEEVKTKSKRLDRSLSRRPSSSRYLGDVGDDSIALHREDLISTDRPDREGAVCRITWCMSFLG